MEKIKIIKLDPSRWEEYKNLRLEYLKSIPEAFTSSYEEKINEPDDYWINKLKFYSGDQGLMLFAEAEGKLVGIIAAYIEKPIKQKHIGFLNSLFIKEDFRGKGISNTLMQQISDWFRSKNLTKLKLEVTTSQDEAVNLYKKFGFEIVGELKQELLVEGKFYNVYEMEKFLK